MDLEPGGPGAGWRLVLDQARRIGIDGVVHDTPWSSRLTHSFVLCTYYDAYDIRCLQDPLGIGRRSFVVHISSRKRARSLVYKCDLDKDFYIIHTKHAIVRSNPVSFDLELHDFTSS